MPTRSWKQLVITASVGYGEAVAPEIWTSAFGLLSAHLHHAFPSLDEEARFHIRFTGHPGAMELLRVKAATADAAFLSKIQATVPPPEGPSSRWEPPQGLYQCNRFFTFLQACSVLRVRGHISIAQDLSGPPTTPKYEDDPLCQEAYRVMRKPHQTWSTQLDSWFDHFDTMPVKGPFLMEDNPFEYAHWFGHIISKRGLAI